VINLLRDEFKRKHERDVDSLSDIAIIVAEREEIKNETAVPKFILQMEANWRFVKIGSEWIISTLHFYRRLLYVYRISRSNGILLKQIHLPLSFIGPINLLLEPFLIMFDENDVLEVHNLLEPKKGPMTIKRSGHFGNYLFWYNENACSTYESDILPNGKLPESILFPVFYQLNDNRICFDCVEIGRSEIKTLWTRNFEYSQSIDVDVRSIDRDNFIFSVEISHVHEFFHVILSKEKVTKYTLEGRFWHEQSYALFEEKIFTYVIRFSDNGDFIFGYFTLPEEGMNFKKLCIFVEEEHTRIKFDGEEILYFTNRVDYENTKIKQIPIRQLLDFINDDNQEKLNWEGEIDGKQVILPIVKLCKFILNFMKK